MQTTSRRLGLTALTLGLLSLAAACGGEDAPTGDGTAPPPSGGPAPGEVADPPDAVALLGDATFPEGILARDNGDLFVTGFGDGSIQRITNGRTVEYFSAPGDNGMVIGVGMAIDEARGRLWVANFDFDLGEGVPGSRLEVFDLETGVLQASLPDDFVPGAFFNELAIADDGTVYASDTLAPRLWTAPADLSGVSELVSDPLLANPAPDRPFGLNGLAITEDGRYLVASVMDRLDAGGGRLVRVARDGGEVRDITLSGDVDAFAGSDGMFFHDGLLLMVNVFSSAGAIVTAELDADATRATLVVRDRFSGVYDRPTASAVRNGRLWTVNSQLDHIIDDGNGALNTPPVTPFEVVHVDLAELLASPSGG